MIANVNIYFAHIRVYTNFYFSIVLNVFFARGLSERLCDKLVIVNTVNPGLCHSELSRNDTGLDAWIMWLMKKFLARTTEEGGRQLIWACIGGKDNVEQLRGAYISSMHVQEPSDFVISEEGKLAQTKLWVNNYLSYTRAMITDKLLGRSD